MPRFTAVVDTSWMPEQAFAYMADLRNFAEWDPGVMAVEQIDGDGPSPDAVYDVTVDNGGRPTTLRYDVTRYDEPHGMQVTGTGGIFRSVDTLQVERTGSGSRVTYDAVLQMRGILRPAGFLLGPVFERIGQRAARGLAEALDRSMEVT